MNIKILSPATVSRWSGGNTAQIALYPPQSSYASRDFLWRLSSATVECESSDFTSLPDYNRIIALLDGSLTLFVEGKEVALEPCEPYRFDGGAKVRSIGRAVDFNLMLRKGKVDGEVTRVRSGELTLRPGATHLLYAVNPLSLSYEGGECTLPSGRCLQIDTDAAPERIQVELSGRALLAGVWEL